MESLICVCGAGTMGRGIALAAASQGISVILYDLNPDIISEAAQHITKEIQQAVEKKIHPPGRKRKNFTGYPIYRPIVRLPGSPHHRSYC